MLGRSGNIYALLYSSTSLIFIAERKLLCSLVLNFFFLDKARKYHFYFSPCKYKFQYLIEDKRDRYCIISREIFMGKQLNACLFKKAYVMEIERFLSWEPLGPV